MRTSSLLLSFVTSFAVMCVFLVLTDQPTQCTQEQIASGVTCSVYSQGQVDGAVAIVLLIVLTLVIAFGIDAELDSQEYRLRRLIREEMKA